MAESNALAERVRKALIAIIDPELGRNVVQTDLLREVTIEGSTARVTLGLTSWATLLQEDLREQCRDAVRGEVPEITSVEVDFVPHHRPAERLGQIGLRVKSVIAVGSGKGGVGKSTVAASLAFALKRAGAKVGLMDADVYGPSIPHLLGVSERPRVADNKVFPIESGGLRVMSMGLVVPADQAVVWRGPMLHGAITQFLRDTEWGELDYLIIDMPPGTGDIALTLSQLLPLTGAVVVCTPQEVALLDAVKAIAMFRKVDIPVLGMVENMSYFLCPDNGKRYDIFGSGGARQKAVELNVAFLGEVPINIAIRERGDAGETEANLSDEATGRFFETIARQVVRNIVAQRKGAPAHTNLPVL
jgi:ATP-binding protein involved in chromosome partitioning